MKYDLSYLELELRELLKKLKKHNTYAMQLENEIILYKLENEKLNNIINKIKQRVLDENKPVASAKEIIDIIGVDKECK